MRYPEGMDHSQLNGLRSFYTPESDTAYEVADLLKKARNSLFWTLTPDTCVQSSQGIATRWHYLKQVFEKLRKPADAYSARMMLRIEDDLADAIKCADERNMELEDQDGKEALLQAVDEYAEIILRALKREMAEDEEAAFEAGEGHV